MKSSLCSKSGQGVVEYILVITVTVIIILGLAQRLYKPLGDFVEGFMGTYVACLLETGELPSLGTSEGVSGECKMPTFEAEPGDELAPGEGSQTARGPRDDPDRSASASARDGSSGSGGSGAGGRASSRRFAAGQGSVNGDARPSGGRRIEIPLEGGGSGSFFQSEAGGGSGSIYRKNTRYVAVSGEVSSEALKKAEKEAAKTTTQKVEGETGGAQKKKMAVQPPPPRAPAQSDEDLSSFDIATVIKYLLIAGIIIILIALLGGQAAQLSKSWEKGE